MEPRKIAPLLLALALPACESNQTPWRPLPAWDAGSEAGTGACVPDLDGRLEAAEMAPSLGVPISMRISPAGQKVAVDVAGAVDPEGRRYWDWSAPLPGEAVAAFEARPVGERWYAGHFPGATFAVGFDAGGALEAVYHHDGEGLWLHGLASREEKPASGQTLLVYSSPVPAWRFPITPGATWSASGEVKNGLLHGLPWIGRDRYEMSVDATGRLILPDVVFEQVHRLRTRVSVEPAAGVKAVTWQVSFAFECFGEVARAVAATGQDQPDFKVATERRRFGL
jgi:hypothetical protein